MDATDSFDADLTDEAAVETLNGISVPPCPGIIAELLEETRREDIDFIRISRLITGDVALAAAVLKSANSPFFALRRKVQSVQQAVAVLGLRNLLKIVYGVVLRQSLGGPGAPPLERFWERSNYNAVVSAYLAGRLPGVSTDDAYTFGLFHDAGIAILTQKFPDYIRTMMRANASTLPVTAIEDEAHHTNHVIVGAQLVSARTGRLGHPLSPRALDLRLAAQACDAGRLPAGGDPPDLRAHRGALPQLSRRRRVGKQHGGGAGPSRLVRGRHRRPGARPGGGPARDPGVVQGGVAVAMPGEQPLEGGAQAGRLVDGELFLDGQVQREVQEGIGFARFRRPLAGQRRFAVIEQGVVFGVLGNEADRRILKGRDDFLRPVLAPGFDEEAAGLVPARIKHRRRRAKARRRCAPGHCRRRAGRSGRRRRRRSAASPGNVP